MKSLLLAVALVVPSFVAAEEVSYLRGFSKFVAEEAGNTMPIGLIGYKSKPEASMYWPGLRFHAKDNPDREYFNVGIGGLWSKDIAGAKPYLGGLLNTTAFLEWAFESAWGKSHVKRSKMPRLFFGPGWLMPFDLDELEHAFSSPEVFFLEYGRIMVGVRF